MSPTIPISWVRLIALLSALLISLLAPITSYSATIEPRDVIHAAEATHTKFIGLEALAGALGEKAIDKGNGALEQRLEQLRGIIQSAIFNLNQVMAERIQDLDQKARKQRMEAIKQLDVLSVNVANTLKVSIDQLNQVLAQNITGFQNALGNSFASLPIPTEPLVNVGQSGLFVIANAEGPTRLFITGSGLFKDGKQPQAYVHEGAADKAGTRLDVESASMGLLTLVLPPKLLPPSATPRLFTLSLGFYKGLLSSVVWPSFTLTVCGALPRYSVRVALSATNGEYWEQKVTDPQWKYIDFGTLKITAQDLTPPGWSVDLDRPGFHSGLTIQWNPPTSPGGEGGHSEAWSQNYDSFVLVASRGSSNSHAFAMAAIKKKTSVSQCGAVQETRTLDYNNVNQIQFLLPVVMGSCDMSLATPNVLAVVELIRQGNVIEKINLPVPTHDQVALGGQLNLSIDQNGLLNMTLKPSCAEKTHFRVAD